MVAAKHPAPQHEPAGGPRYPRPLPLFLDMVQRAAGTDPALAARVLRGVAVYVAARRAPAPDRPVVATCGRARLLGAGDSGAPVVLVPSLINPASVLDLDAERSLLGFLGANGRRAMLLDWGAPGADEAGLTIAGHVETLLLPLLEQIGEPVHLIGYCLGGTMSLAAAQLGPVRSLALLATPWHFDSYPEEARAALAALWRDNRPAVEALGLMPVELLQSAFWAIDPERTLAKYAALADRDSADHSVTAFAALEDWANDGAPLTAAAAADLFERMIDRDEPGRGQWRVGGVAIDPRRIAAPAMQLTATGDRIAPAATAARAIRATACAAGHVGMIVGSRAKEQCWRPLLDWTATH